MDRGLDKKCPVLYYGDIMGLKTFDKWPDGNTTIDKKHWTSDEPIPEVESSEDFKTPPEEDGDNLGLKVAIQRIGYDRCNH